MSRWFAWFQVKEGAEPFFKVLIADNLNTAEMMATDMAGRDKVILVGIIGASAQFSLVTE